MAAYYLRVPMLCIVLFYLCSSFSAGQDVPAAETTPTAESASDAESIEPLQIRLSVNEVRLDVVVLDNKRNPVKDLTAKDFEVFQNGARQNILSSVYIDNQFVTAPKPSVARRDNRNLTLLPTADYKREDTGRTIILVVDDLSMSFQNGHHARMALRNFVEKQMQHGDMVAFLRTSRGNSALQLFLSDKGQALARIDAMRMETAISPNADGSHLFRVYDNQLSTLSYSLRALKDMPGRKFFIMMTAIPSLRKPNNTSLAIYEDGESAPLERIDFNALYKDRFNRLADDALRAGVVVNFLNIGGLSAFDNANDESDGRIEIEKDLMLEDMIRATSAGGNFAELTIEQIKRSGKVPDQIQRKLEAMFPQQFENENNASPLNILNPLPVKTGGVIIENSNFFLDGIGKETESLIKGYYLISYEPPSDTFKTDDKEVFNQIKVNVRRRNVQVHTRDGFYNSLESERNASAEPAHPLQDAVFSPFLHADLNVNVAAGYLRDVKAGHLVRSWIHLDPKDVKIVETEDGGARIDLEMVCLTSDTNGFVQDFKFIEHTLTIEPENKTENLSRIQKHGIRFAMLLPVEKPGSYYIRVAVRDKESGKTGSAYQFVEIPDPGKKGLALSNIFMIPGADDLNWLLSDTASESADGLFFPVFHAEEVRSPALRTYTVGDAIQILAMLYNAEEKAIAGSEVEMQFVLYKDGNEYLRSGRPVGLGRAGNLDGIPISLRFTMGTDIPPGDYALQLVVTDVRNSRRQEGNASQAISFTVVEKY